MMKTVTLSLFIVLALASCTPQPEKKEEAKAAPTDEEMIERGRYLINSIGCDDCHSPKMMTDHGPVPDPATRFAGHIEGDLKDKVSKDALDNWVLFNGGLTAAVGPWGISYAANISSDDSGVGLWTDEQFIRAIREGQYKGMEGTRKLLPPMPWPNYAHLTDDDLKAMLKYLKSTNPVRNIPPEPVGPDQLMN